MTYYNIVQYTQIPVLFWNSLRFGLRLVPSSIAKKAPVAKTYVLIPIPTDF